MAVCARRGGARPLCDVETTLATVEGGKKQNGGGIVRYICVGWLCFKSQENLDQRVAGGLRALPEHHRYNHQISWARVPPLSPRQLAPVAVWVLVRAARRLGVRNMRRMCDIGSAAV